MTTYTWTGAASTAWATTTNWSPNGTPGSGDTVIIPTAATHLPTLSSSTSIAALTISGADILTLSGSSTTLTVSGTTTLSSSGGVTGIGTLASTVTASAGATATITASGGTLTITGAITNSGSLALATGSGGSDHLILNAASAATSMTFGGTTGTLEIGAAGSLTLANQLAVGTNTLKLDGGSTTLTDAAGITLSSGTITGIGKIAATIAASGGLTGKITETGGGTLELTSAISYSGTGTALTITVGATASDRLLIDSTVAATKVAFASSTGSGTLEIASGATLSVANTSAIACGSNTLKLDGGGATVTSTKNITFSTGALTGSGEVVASVTGSNAATITATGGTLQFTSTVKSTGTNGALALVIGGGTTDRLVLGGVSTAQSVTFSGIAGGTGVLELGSGATLTVANALAIGACTIQTDGVGSTLTDAGGISLAGGSITGPGKLGAATPVSGYGVIGAVATLSKTITASGGTLEFQNTVTNSGGTLALNIGAGATDKLLLDAVSTAHSLAFAGSTGTLEINTAGTLTVTNAVAIGANTVKLDGTGSTLTDTAGLTLAGGLITGSGKLSATTGLSGYGVIAIAMSPSAAITASGGTLEFQDAIANGGSLALAVGGGATDKLLLDAADAATSLSFSGSTGTLELNTSGTLTLANALAIGANTVKLDASASTLTDAAGVTIGAGLITGVGTVAAAVSATGPATITASGGALALTGAITNSGSLALAIGAGASDRLLIDAAAAATSLAFSGSTGTLELNTGGALTLANAASIGANTVQLDGAGATLTNAAGVTLATAKVTGAGTLAAPVTATGAATITATGGTLAITGAIVNSGSLALVIGGGATDRLLLDAASAATSLTFAATTGTLEINASGSLTLSNALAIGANTVKLDGASSTLTDAAGMTISSGAITGTGKVAAAVTATGAASITASGGTLEFASTVSNGGGLALDVNIGATDRLMLDAASAATSLNFAGSTGTLELNTAGTLTLANALAIGANTLQLDGSGSVLTDASGVSISTGAITGAGKVAAIVTATGAATISASGGKLEFTGAVSNAGSLALTIGGGATDKLLLDATSAATSLAFAGSAGTLEINTSGALTLANALSIGANSVKLDGSSSILTDAAGLTLATGAITGVGEVSAAITATGAATITAGGGTLELAGAVTNSGALALTVGAGASDRLLLDAADSAQSLTFSGSTGTLELNSSGSLTLANALAIGANTVKLDGPSSFLTDAAGVTLAGGAIFGSGALGANTNISGYGSVGVAVAPSGSITASGGTLEFHNTVTDGGGLALTIGGGATDKLLLDGVSSAMSLTFSGSTGTLEINTSGALTLLDALTVNSGNTLKLDGSATTFTDDPGILLNGGLITGSGSVAANTEIIGYGTVAIPLSVNNAVTATGGTLEFTGSVDGTAAGVFQIANVAGSVLKFDGAVGTASILPTIVFNGATSPVGVLDLTSTTLSNFHAVLGNFFGGDSIRIAGAATVSLDASGKVLTVYNASSVSLGAIDFASSYTGDTFTVSGGAISVDALVGSLQVSISGTAQVGQRLTASTSAGSGYTVTYQWQRSTDGGATYQAISGATGSNYVAQLVDEGDLIEAVATATNSSGSAAATSSPTSAVLDAAPTVTPPTVTGAFAVGQTLTASAAAGESGNTLTWQWERSTDGGATFQTISGATGSSYVVQSADANAKIEVIATVTNLNGATASAIGAVPTVTTPAIAGVAQEGQTLTASATAGLGDSAVGYQWLRSTNGGASYQAISGATGATYIGQFADIADKLEVVATVADTDGATVTSTSMATSAVLDAAPTVTTPTIMGTAQEGQTLTASASAGEASNTLSWHWMRSTNGGTSFQAISGATSATYVEQFADVGNKLEAVATVTNLNGATTSAASAATRSVLDAAPTVTTPTISGTAQEGATLTASATAGEASNTLSYQWLRSTNGGTSYQAIAGATSAAYVEQFADVGAQLEAVATVTNANSVTTAATSAATSTVLDAAPTVTTPTIAGTAQEGQTLTASATAGEVSNTLSYQWLRSANGGTSYQAISGATGATYIEQFADIGDKLEVIATATNANGATASSTSTATATVLDAAPVLTSVTVTGTAQVGQSLTASATAGEASNTLSYQWRESTNQGLSYQNIAGATGSVYIVQTSDYGDTILVVATATNANSVTASAASAASDVVLDAAPTVTTPTISGTAQEGQTLTASATAGEASNTLTWQWQESTNGGTSYQAISGATGATYVIQSTDFGDKLQAVVTDTNLDGVTTAATSVATSAVLDVSPTVTTPTVTGTDQAGKTLTAAATAGPSDATLSWQWMRSSNGGASYQAISGATSATYVEQEADVGDKLVAVATSTNASSVTVSSTSTATAAVLDAAPTVTTPTIAGADQAGATLTAAATAGPSDATLSWQWMRSTNGGASYQAISGATSATYVEQEADVGDKLEVVATSTNANAVSVSSTSLATATVLDAAPTVTTPTIAGADQAGATLTASATAGPSDATLSWQWLRSTNGGTSYQAISGATGATYVEQEADVGDKLEAVATSTNANSVSTAATSAATSAVLDAAPTVTTPTVTGTDQAGKTLTAAATAGPSDATLSWQWMRSSNGGASYQAISGATSATYVEQEADVGDKLVAVATSTNASSVTVSSTSTATAAVLDAAPTVTTPTIAGADQAGATLTAAATAGPSDATLSWQWMRSTNGGASYQAISGATSATYVEQEADVGDKLEVVATSTNANAVSVSSTSLATATVLDAAPTVTTPTIAGADQAGATLTASATAGPSDATLSWQWLRSTNGGTSYQAISGATGATYVEQEADVGDKLEAVATSTNANSVSTAATSAATSAVLDAAPTVTTPTVTGTDQAGKTLTASATAGPSDATLSWQWMRSTNGGTSYQAISGATAVTYVEQEADVGDRLEVVATSTNANSVTTAATSAATSAILDAAPSITLPTITGTAQEGATLSAAATAGPSDATLSWQWMRSTNGGASYQAISGATGATYVEQFADVGDKLEVIATATNANSVTTAATSAATSSVLDAAPTVTMPTISGTAQEGATLTASATAGEASNTLSYQWLRSTNGGTSYQAIAGAVSATYVEQFADVGDKLEAVATVTNTNGVTTAATSAATGSVLDAAPTVTTPTIAGTPQVNQTLTASASPGEPSNALSYQWRESTDGGASYQAIAGATGNTYVVQKSDEGDPIEVVATVTNADGVSVSSTSSATAAVLDATPVLTSVTISGAAQEGQTLTASATAQEVSNTLSYQWQESTDGGATYQAIAGATGAAYVVQFSDEWGLIEVVATAANANGVTVSAASAATAPVLDAAPVLTSVSVAGTAQVGQTLTATATAQEASNTIAYQWRESTDGGVTYQAIVGATGAAYVVQYGDEADLIEVVATATNANGATTDAASAATSPVLDAAPSVTTPTISGTAQQGATLTASATVGEASNIVTYQWVESTDGGLTYQAIAGATSAAYVVQAGDEADLIEVVATAANDDGVTTAATSAAVLVEPAAPTIASIVGVAVNGRTFTIDGTGVAGDTVTLYADKGAVTLGSGLVGAGGAFSIVTTAALADGYHTVTATQTDPEGVTGASSSALSFTVDPNAPQFTGVIGHPVNGAPIVITGTAEAGDKITLYSAGTVVGCGTVTSGGTFDITTAATFDDGRYALTATATDRLGLVSLMNAGLGVPVLPNAPTISGLVGQLASGRVLEIAGTAEAGATVTLYSATKAVGTGTVGLNGLFDITTTAPFGDGKFSLTAKEIDGAGLTSLVSNSLTVCIDPSQPTLTLVTALPIDGGKIKVMGVGAAGETIKVYDGATVVGSGKAGAGGIYQIVTTATFPDGSVTLTAVDTDTAGLSSIASAPLMITVKPAAPTLAGVVGAHTIGSAIEVTGTGEAGETLTLYDDGKQIWTGAISAATFDILTTATYSKGANAVTAKESDSLGLTSALSKALSVTAVTARHATSRTAAVFTQMAAGSVANTSGSAHDRGHTLSFGPRIETHPLLAAR